VEGVWALIIAVTILSRLRLTLGKVFMYEMYAIGASRPCIEARENDDKRIRGIGCNEDEKEEREGKRWPQEGSTRCL
jgi:hypothetical protein